MISWGEAGCCRERMTPSTTVTIFSGFHRMIGNYNRIFRIVLVSKHAHLCAVKYDEGENKPTQRLIFYRQQTSLSSFVYFATISNLRKKKRFPEKFLASLKLE